jgi:hypothetical protein
MSEGGRTFGTGTFFRPMGKGIPYWWEETSPGGRGRRPSGWREVGSPRYFKQMFATGGASGTKIARIRL